MPVGKELHFKSKESYGKWLAYGKIHNVFKNHSKEELYPKIFVKGKLQTVEHKR